MFIQLRKRIIVRLEHLNVPFRRHFASKPSPRSPLLLCLCGVLDRTELDVKGRAASESAGKILRCHENCCAVVLRAVGDPLQPAGANAVVPFSYLWTCWNVTPAALPRSAWLVFTITRCKRILMPS